MNDFIAALKGEPHERTPVWFMRQAGRYLPGYISLRKEHSIKEICADRNLTVKVTEEPLALLGVDAAIIFADITTPIEAMGFGLEFKEGLGPVISKSFSEDPELRDIHDFDISEFRYSTYSAIREFKERNPQFPIIGFAGGPLTISSYIVAGKADRDLAKTRRLLYGRNANFSRLMEMTKEMVIENCRAQIRSGADAIQIFDSWAGFLSPSEFREYSNRYLKDIVNELSGGVPLIYFSTQTTGMLEELQSTGFNVLSLDWRCDLPSVSRKIKGETGLQGNIDPTLVAGSPELSVREAKRLVNGMSERDNYILNLGHGVLPDTKKETLREIVRTAHQFRGRK